MSQVKRRKMAVRENERCVEDTQPGSLPLFESDHDSVRMYWTKREEELSAYTTEYVLENKVCAVDNTHVCMWWIDAYERLDSVYLFGKIYNNRHHAMSCCVLVQNIDREIYVLPRETTEDGCRVSMDEVRKEIHELFDKMNIQLRSEEVCIRSYAFELPDIPSETEYLKLNYSYHDYPLSPDLQGRTFKHVFGTNTSPLEHLIVKRQIMGPCWLDFKNIKLPSDNPSWCTAYAVVTSMDDCTIHHSTTTFPLNIMSLHIQTRLNTKNSKNEIMAITLMEARESDINQLDPDGLLPHMKLTIMRPLNEDQILPTHPSIQWENTEEGLLGSFLAILDRSDPDIIVGHHFLTTYLDILLSRMKHLKIKHWHKLGRLKHTGYPKFSNRWSEKNIHEKQRVMKGRIICDTFLATKEIIKSTTYSLSELSLSQLNIIREEEGPADLLDVVRHYSFDAYLTLAIMTKLQILSITKQLTNLSGNLWARSMHGARADRNEYLLLHTFYARNYIYPDKPRIQHEGEEVLDVPRKGTESFQGGLVLEPRSGYYENYVMILDFNSLYPSIIQEYNICFTTLDYRKEIDPDHFEVSSQLGVLPELSHLFVSQRSHIKSLMRHCDPHARSQYHSEQMALKLTANSLYGCLGSPYSRFYAKPLAMLITHQGRKILKTTHDMAHRMQLDVIYGDTDSIMIHTKTKHLVEAKQMAESFRSLVNQQYREIKIDVDYYFRHTLLLKKKKYAGLAVRETSEGLVESMEIKGLDLVRKDWCALSRQWSKSILKLILLEKNHETVVYYIKEYLMEVRLNLDYNRYDIEEFIIYKQLIKSPEEYENINHHPHVLVANQMRKAGSRVKPGDTVPYIMCKDGDRTVPLRPIDVKNGNAVIDVQWYLVSQIIPPILRLCSPLPDITFDTLAECLGVVQHKKKRTKATNEPLSHRSFTTTLVCSFCHRPGQYSGTSMNCPSCDLMNEASIETQLTVMIRQYIHQYYTSDFYCTWMLWKGIKKVYRKDVE
ncbi:hypothetical protein BDB01DRAFT_855335 [Pilobolus umbonatus]|nr:hypothetical protein BDB01DRAFT_855335 [Pilobolus umbonatus]